MTRAVRRATTQGAAWPVLGSVMNLSALRAGETARRAPVGPDLFTPYAASGAPTAAK